MQRTVGTLVLVALCQASCSDETSGSKSLSTGSVSGSGGRAEGGSSTGGMNTGGSGSNGIGGSGSNGIGGLAMAGSVRGAVSLNIVGDGCSVPSQYIDFPPLSSGHPVSASGLIESVTDDVPTTSGLQVSISCGWRTSSMSAGLTIGGGPNVRVVSLGSGTVVGETSIGGISVRVPGLAEGYVSTADGPCSYEPIEVDEATNTIWGAFSCATLQTQNGSDRCALGPSYFYFENCPDQ